MLNRREFVGTGSAAGLALAAGCLPEPATEPGERDRPVLPEGPIAPDDEGAWTQVRGAYDLEPGLINLNHGLSPAPRSVQESLFEELRRLNQAPLLRMPGDTEGRREESRVALAQLLGCDAEEVAITRSGVEALQIAQQGIELGAGDEVLSTREDYWSAWNTWQQRVAREGIVYSEIDLGGPYPEPDEIVRRFERAVTARTRVILFCHLTWRTGHVLPVAEICRMARERGIQTIVDGAHALAHVPFSLEDLGCDYYAASGHKWLGAPLGTGVLYVRKSRIAGLWPPAATFLGDARGGEDIRKLETLGSRPSALHNALAGAVRFSTALGVEQKADRLHYLKTLWADRLGRHERVRIVTDLRRGRSFGIASFHVDGMESAVVATRLHEEHGILVGGPAEDSWSGPPLVRIAPNVFTSVDEIGALVEAVETVARL